MSTRLGLHHPLKLLVRTKFRQAKEEKEVVFSETHLCILPSAEIGTYQLRHLPTLARKPNDSILKLDKSSQTTPETASNKPQHRFDPFDNPAEGLLIASVPVASPSHNLVLNKFPVIPNHFILATKDNKPQDHLLQVDDLSLAYDCVKAWQDVEESASGEETQQGTNVSLYAFFNSGLHSGASQPHRHVQFLPVEDMAASYDNGWSMLVDSMNMQYRPHLELLYNPALPILHYAVKVQTEMSPQELHQKYLLLLQATWFTLAHGTADFSEGDLKQSAITQPPNVHHDRAKATPTPVAEDDLNNKVGFDYNLCLTLDRMAIMPRFAGDATVSQTTTSDDERISVNGTILAGTLMTKSEKHWQTLKANPALLQDILKQIGYPRSKGTSL